MFYPDSSVKELETSAREALARFAETKNKIGLENLDNRTLVLCASEIETYLLEYVNFHKKAKQDKKEIEVRRQDHWDLLNKKCSEDPMFKGLWEELMTLLSLETDESKTKEEIERLRIKHVNLLK